MPKLAAIKSLYLFASILWATASAHAEHSVREHSFQTLDEIDRSFVTTNGKSTLLLFVSEKEELNEAFRIATIIPNGTRPYACYVMIDLSQKSILKAMALKSSARRFIKGTTSRQSIALLDTDSLQQALSTSAYIPTKSALVDSQGVIVWTSNAYPSDEMVAQLASGDPIK